jgi:hypothetical protein
MISGNFFRKKMNKKWRFLTQMKSGRMEQRKNLSFLKVG